MLNIIDGQEQMITGLTWEDSNGVQRQVYQYQNTYLNVSNGVIAAGIPTNRHTTNFNATVETSLDFVLQTSYKGGDLTLKFLSPIVNQTQGVGSYTMSFDYDDGQGGTGTINISNQDFGGPNPRQSTVSVAGSSASVSVSLSNFTLTNNVTNTSENITAFGFTLANDEADETVISTTQPATGNDSQYVELQSNGDIRLAYPSNQTVNKMRIQMQYTKN